MILEVDTADRHLVSGLLVLRRQLDSSDHHVVGSLAQAPGLAETLEPAHWSRPGWRRDLRYVVSVWKFICCGNAKKCAHLTKIFDVTLLNCFVQLQHFNRRTYLANVNVLEAGQY
jgi:hypothetical protein